MMLSGELFIGGQWIEGRGNDLTSLDPAEQTSIWHGRMADDEQALDVVEVAVKGGQTWRAMGFEERLSIVKSFEDQLRENKDTLALLISRETGKPFWDAAGEAASMIGKIAISVDAYHERTGVRETEANGVTLVTRHHAHGVMVVLGPFNFPGHLPNGHIVPALLAGNSVIFKPSEQTPAVAELTIRLWEAAGLPKGVINLVHGDAGTARQLISHDDVAGVLFTGGVKAGLSIHRDLAGHPDKIVALELGGNNPIVAWGAHDTLGAARMIVRSAYLSGGQRCTCARRLIVGKDESSQNLMKKVVELAGRLAINHPRADPNPFMGALISEHARDSVLRGQAHLEGLGGDVLLKAGAMDLGPAFVSPGIIDMSNAAAASDDEIFGPLLQVYQVDEFEEAVALANNTRFGLASALLSDDSSLFEPFLNQSRAGIVNINQPTAGASGRAPFGGIGLSGNHRPAGYYAADYCAYPRASMVRSNASDETPLPGEQDR
ncbi:succinylglutamate-semialdehyde dehydrogenase [Coralliovum pocilloporae]|uniref:succinylglutamate-semialdehyde dehydrogenase n=1 Tax=Coralliovum pocilloporae TaxID=3066369 RepID=UPI003307640F